MSRTALLVIATGPAYCSYAENLIASAKKFFVPHDVIMFTDDHRGFAVEEQFATQARGYPGTTLMRYHTFWDRRDVLRKYDYLFYSDADMQFVAPVSEQDIFAEGITATLHPGFAVDRYPPLHIRTSTVGTPERRERSTAFIPIEAKNAYYCGGFNGGRTVDFLRMTETLVNNINTDNRNGILALWHDESHLNRYLFDKPPARVLTPSFCYPEGYSGGFGWDPAHHPPVLLALNKGGRR